MKNERYTKILGLNRFKNFQKSNIKN